MPHAELSPPLNSALAAIRDSTAGMSEGQLAWHPEGKWSSADILEHLSLAYLRTADRMTTLLQGELPDVRRRIFKEWVGGMIVLKLGRIPTGRKAPEGLVPRGMSPAEAKTTIAEKLCRMDQVIDQCEQRFGRKRSVLVHPILGPLSAPEWRRFHCVHTLHHVKQIQALRRKMQESGDPGQTGTAHAGSSH